MKVKLTNQIINPNQFKTVYALEEAKVIRNIFQDIPRSFIIYNYNNTIYYI